MRRPDHHNEIQLNMLSRGRVTYLLGSSMVHVKPNHFTAFWAAIPHQIVDYDPDTEYFVATLPLAWFLQCQLPDTIVKPLMHGEVVEEPRVERSDFDTALFRQWVADLEESNSTVREIVTAEMKIRLQRLALQLDANDSKSSSRQPVIAQVGALNKVEQMVCHIAQNYMNSITSTDIGQAVGLHPNSAMRMFKKTFGTTLVDYLTQHRVFHAKRLLATTDQKIIDIAFGSGFNSVSRFNAAFKKVCGCAPREYRVAHGLEFSD